MELGISLDQLRVFAVVLEEGSFSAAARRLNRSQSAVTYTIQKLEDLTGSVLFDRSGYRPNLTEAGRALLPRARRVVETSAAFVRQAKALQEGIEAEVSLVVDSMYPMPLLFAVLSDFDRRFPSVQPRLFVESLGATAKMVQDGKADLGVIIDFAGISEELISTRLDPIEFVPVVAPGHALDRRAESDAGPLEDDDLRDHLQLVLTDRSEMTKGRDYGVLGIRTWRLGDLGAKHAMLLAGMGWGFMPLHVVSTDLAAGRLVELDLAHWPNKNRRLALGAAIVRRRDQPLGPAGAWLLDRLSAEE